MAKHETEMHRARRMLTEFARHVRDSKDAPADLRNMAMLTLKAVQPDCDVGMFGERDQLDLADRRDLP